MRIAMIGTRGVPPRYGGFETAVEEVGRRLSRARARGDGLLPKPRPDAEQLPGHAAGQPAGAAQPRARDAEPHRSCPSRTSVTKRRPDVAIVFNAANAPLLPMLQGGADPARGARRRARVEARQVGGPGARYYRGAEKLVGADGRRADRRCARHRRPHPRRARPRVASTSPTARRWSLPVDDRLVELGISPQRLPPGRRPVRAGEPRSRDRRGLRRLRGAQPVGGRRRRARTTTRTPREVQAAAKCDPRVRLLGSVWDQVLLDQLYANALSYIHGHSVGGTNPSLLRAMGAGAPVTAFDAVFNREVVNGHARYFTDPLDVAMAVTGDEHDIVAAHGARREGPGPRRADVPLGRGRRRVRAAVPGPGARPLTTAPRLAVVLAAHNGERFIAEQLASLTHQTRPPDLLVVSDDGSRDRTQRSAATSRAGRHSRWSCVSSRAVRPSARCSTGSARRSRAASRPSRTLTSWHSATRTTSG